MTIDLNNIRESDILTAIKMGDLDEACSYLQGIAKIEDGGIAALAFSDVTFDWATADQDSREKMVRAWLKLEAAYLACEPTGKSIQ
jgi:hypothetical protein